MIVILSCGKSKQYIPAKAIDIYIGILFRQKLIYTKTFYPNADIYIYIECKVRDHSCG